MNELQNEYDKKGNRQARMFTCFLMGGLLLIALCLLLVAILYLPDLLQSIGELQS